MPQFYYRALSKDNEVIKGQNEAQNEEVIIAQLTEKDLLPISISEKGMSSSFWELLNKDLNNNNKISKNELLSFTKEFSTLLNAGINIENSFIMMIEFSKQVHRKKVLSSILESMQNGTSLSEAMKNSSLLFPNDYIAVIKAGEDSGQLKTLLSHQETSIENQININNEIRSSLIYPGFLLIVSILAIGVLVGVVLPGFKEIFNSSNIELPYMTAALLNVGDWLKNNFLYIFCVLSLIIGIIYWALKNNVSRTHIDRVLLQTPLLGSILKFEATSKFATIMSTLLSGGINLPDALDISKDTISNLHIKKCLSEANIELREGKQLSHCLTHQYIFPEYAIRLLSVGEKTGRLSNILYEIGKIYSIKLKHTLKNFVALIVPVMIVTFGAFIGLLIYALLSAILSLNELAF